MPPKPESLPPKREHGIDSVPQSLIEFVDNRVQAGSDADRQWVHDLLAHIVAHLD
jgi:hypothetical protein